MVRTHLEPEPLATDRPHPASLDEVELMAQCQVSRTRRSGPGGQHRNKVETAVVIEHRPTGVRGEASEERSQACNKTMAIKRLRLNLALKVRTDSTNAPGELWKSRSRGGRIQVGEKHADFPALVAEAFDVLTDAEFDHKVLSLIHI